MMLFAYLEVIYKTMHMELLKTWHQQFVEDHGSTQQKLNIQLVFASSHREAVQFWRLLKRVCQWRKTLESLHKFQPCPRGKHPAMHCLSLHSCCFEKSGQLQLVLAVGTALLHSLGSSPGAVLCWSLSRLFLQILPSPSTRLGDTLNWNIWIWVLLRNWQHFTSICAVCRWILFSESLCWEPNSPFPYLFVR